MNWRAHVRSHLPQLAVSPEREIEIVDELAGQLEATYQQACANGATDREAIARAEAEVPDWAALARTLGRIERPYLQPPVAGAGQGGLMTGLGQDLRYAVRAIARTPGFAVVSIATLALGIAATTIVYSLVDGILLRPLPIQDPDRVVLARETFKGDETSISWPNFVDWRARARSFERLAAWRGFSPNLTGFDQPRRILARQVTANLFGVLGVKPILGRDFTDADDQWGVARVCLVSHGFWQRELGGTVAAVGRHIMLDEQPVEVVGILPASFTIARAEDIWLPFGNYLRPGSFMFGRGNHFGLAAIGRLKPGVSVESANAEVVTLARQLEQEHPDTNSGNGGIARPLFDVLVGSSRSMLFVLLGAVAAMLLIACVNLANLLLARAAARAQEMAVRRALGAARWRIARQMLTESVLLALAGGVAGVGLAFAGYEGVVALLPDQPRVHTVAIDLRVLAVSAAVSLATGILFGLVPALHAATGRASLLLRSARVTGTGQSSAPTRRGLMLAEVALALVLVAGAGLMLRTMANLLSVDTGVDTARVITAQFSLPQRYDTDKRLVFLDSAIERVRAIPGVTNAAFTYSLPVAGSNWNSIFIIQGQTIPDRSELPSAAWTPVSTGYFDTMGIRSVEGRQFESLDGAANQPVAIVNRTFASRFFPSGSAVGGMVKQGWPEEKGTWRQIVGVVGDVNVTGIEASPGPQVYLPVTQNGQMSGALVARTDGDPRLLARALEAAVHEVDRNLPVYDIRSMDEVIGFGIGPQRMTMVLMIGFAGLALLMAGIGVFGVTAYSVSQRTHEIGVRIALGADSSRVLGLVLRQELLACLLGIGLGVIGAVLLSSLLRSLLFGIAPRDPVTLAGAAMVLLLVTIVACYLPARRATLVDPMSALRSE